MIATLKIETFHFKDDGNIPNSTLPLIIYREACTEKDMANWFEQTFAGHYWSNSWRNGIYDYHHYHSNTHEVLGVYQGTAKLMLGGDQGKVVEVKAGDVLIIPAGVGHKNLESHDLGVVGAYPFGAEPDLMKGKAAERPAADKNIAAVKLPQMDPLTGVNGGLNKLWKKGDT